MRHATPGEVAARLDENRSYGVFWSNRAFTTRKRVLETNGGGRGYRWRYSVQKNPKEKWIAIPVPDAGLSRMVVDAAREMVADNRRKTNKGRRLFELGGVVYCGGCGKKTQHSANLIRGRIYPYYKCRRVVRDGGSRPNHRAEELEGRIWGFVSELVKSPERLREDLERMVELETRELRTDPEREAKAWLEKLAEADRWRSGYQDLAAKGFMNPFELGKTRGRRARTGGVAGPTGPDRAAGTGQGRGTKHPRQNGPGGPGRALSRGTPSALQVAAIEGGRQRRTGPGSERGIGDGFCANRNGIKIAA